MTRITNVDQVILLLQSQLKRMNKADKKRGPVTQKQEVQNRPLARVQSMAKKNALSQEEIQRALISGILTEKFGASVSNDPAFQTVIDNVTAALQNDEESQQLLGQAVNQLTDFSKNPA